MKFNRIQNIIIPAGLVVAGVLAVSSCRGKDASEASAHKDLPQEVKSVAMAIIENSPEEFASGMNYPIERPYPLKDVKDSSEMVKYYPVLVDDSLKNVVRESPDTAWQEAGWRGWTLDNGSFLWIDSGKAYAINYVSKRETQILDSLRIQEISTLDPSMQSGWTPVLCVIDTIDGAIFRIDTYTLFEGNRYRLAGYRMEDDLSGSPTILLYGQLDEEGTLSSRFYHFRDSVGNSANYSPDVLAEPDSLPEIEVKRDGKMKRYRVRPDYWLDQFERRRRKMRADSVRHELAVGIALKPDSAAVVDASDSNGE